MEKIRISADDIARTGPQPTAPFPPLAAAPPADLQRATVRRVPPWLLAAGGVAILALALVLVVFLSRPRDLTMDQWLDAERQHLTTEFATSPKVKPYIERIHPLVTFTGASVKSLTATTIDGSTRTGKHGSNIAEIQFVITYHWEGPVQKNGYTEVLYVWDMQANQLKTSQYLATTALMNLDNIDWLKLGAELVPILFGGN